ncbi:hypothetical protein ABEW34_17130 [Paenibacillus algorifonticola]|uniref:hypothetical protein n=1 Tax=Paenibacillus algorifonticola TaxID=684063 RepID=UPI003D29BE18
MLNGKKSYLLSFTALFSKKGYELTFGLDYLVDVNNQYHLTAPVSSTYQALIEDKMKEAGKTPNVATGAFGKSYKASYVSEPEGKEMETVLASIVNYLNRVHEYLSADYSVIRSPLAQMDESENSNHSGIFEAALSEGNEAAFQTIPEVGEVARSAAAAQADKDLLVEQFKLGEQRSPLADNQSDVQSRYVFDVVNASKATRLFKVERAIPESAQPVEAAPFYENERQNIVDRPTELNPAINQSKDFEIETEAFHAAQKNNPFLYGTTGESFSHTIRQNEMADGEIEAFSNTLNVTDDTHKAYTSHYYNAGSASKDEVVQVELESALSGNKEEGTMELLSEAIDGSRREADVAWSTYSSVDNVNADAQINLLAASSSHSGVEGEIAADTLSDHIKQILSSDPHVSKVARLMEIMYGSAAFEMIESGMEQIGTRALSEKLSEADAQAAADAIIDSLEQMFTDARADGFMHVTETAGGSGNLLSFTSETELAEASGNKAGIAEIPEHAYTRSPYSGIMDETTLLNQSGLGQEVWLHHIGQAITDANSKLAEGPDFEYADKAGQAEGVQDITQTAANGLGLEDTNLQLSETAQYVDRMKDYVMQETEQAQYKDYLTYQSENDRTEASYVTEFEGTAQPMETSMFKDKDTQLLISDPAMAESASDYNSILHQPDKAAIAASNEEAFYENVEGADLFAPDYFNVLHQDERAESINSNEVIMELDGVGRGETVLDAIRHEEGSTHFGDVSMPAILDETAAGQSETVLNAVTQLSHSAENKLFINGGDEEEIISADNVLSINGGDVAEANEAIRKRRLTETNIQEHEQSSRKHAPLEVDIESSEHAERKRIIHQTEPISPSAGERRKAILETDIAQPIGGKRHKTIEVSIDEAEQGRMTTHPEQKKPRIWLIIGKIASWSIWNWKKTR